MDVRNLIKELDCKKFFVLDTKQDGLSCEIDYNDADVTYHKYCYNIHKYNKLEKGSIFLYRQTKRSSKNRKFYFFGGGIISDIEPIDSDGNVNALVSNAFKFTFPIYEDDLKLEEINWTSKVKTKGKWAYFWNQYGMNEITKYEFLGIIDGVECVDVKEFFKDNFIEEFVEENKEILNLKDDLGTFKGVYTKNGKVISDKFVENKRVFNARKIDFNLLNKAKKTLGTIGEILVFNDEVRKNSVFNNENEVEHVALTKGDGLGYDIVSFNENGEKIYIEVKTTTSNKKDNFYLSPKEIEVARREKNYKLYRVYNLDMNLGTYNVEIYDGKDLEEIFDLVPVSFKAVKKN